MKFRIDVHVIPLALLFNNTPAIPQNCPFTYRIRFTELLNIIPEVFHVIPSVEVYIDPSFAPATRIDPENVMLVKLEPVKPFTVHATQLIPFELDASVEPEANHLLKAGTY